MEGEVWDFVALEMRTDSWKIRHFIRDNSGPVSDATELKFAF
jgi:hypothetical protein